MKSRLLAGALAGALGGLAMKAVVRFIDPHSFGLSARTDANTTHELCRRLHWNPVHEKQAAQAGALMHYTFSVAAAAAYAAASQKFPTVRAGQGPAFGAALWLIGDELAVSFAGLENPFLATAFSHASALGAHLLYGLIVDAAIEASSATAR